MVVVLALGDAGPPVMDPVMEAERARTCSEMGRGRGGGKLLLMMMIIMGVAESVG